MESSHALAATSQITTPGSGTLNPVQSTTQHSKAALNEIVQHYGPWCSESVGAAKIAALPKVTAMQLNLRGESSYYSCRVNPEHLGNVSAVRYKDSMDRWGLAVRCIDDEGVEFVELIFQRYSADKDNYVTALSNRGTDGRIHNSRLYASGGMSKEYLKRVGDLLDGKTVMSIGNCTSLKMAEPRALTSAEKILLTFGNEYGNYCCDIIGIETIRRLPVLSTEELGLDPTNGDLTSMSNLDVLQGHPAVRFVSKERGGPGIAIHVRQFNEIDKTTVDSVEFIYSRYGYPITWKSTSSCLVDDDKGYSKVSLEKVRDLLQGKKVPSKTAEGISLQMVQPVLPTRKTRPKGVTLSLGGRFPDSVYRALR